MGRKPRPPADRPPEGQHLATVSHEGRFWDVYLELRDDPRHPETYRGVLAFSAADGAEDDQPLRTIPVLIERSWEDLRRKALDLEDHQLVGFLRSLLP